MILLRQRMYSAAEVGQKIGNKIILSGGKRKFAKAVSKQEKNARKAFNRGLLGRSEGAAAEEKARMGRIVQLEKPAQYVPTERIQATPGGYKSGTGLGRISNKTNINEHITNKGIIEANPKARGWGYVKMPDNSYSYFG